MKLSSSGSSKHPKVLKAPKVYFRIHILKTPKYPWHLHNDIYKGNTVWFWFVIDEQVGGNFLNETKWLLLQ